MRSLPLGLQLLQRVHDLDLRLVLLEPEDDLHDRPPRPDRDACGQLVGQHHVLRSARPRTRTGCRAHPARPCAPPAGTPTAAPPSARGSRPRASARARAVRRRARTATPPARRARHRLNRAASPSGSWAAIRSNSLPARHAMVQANGAPQAAPPFRRPGCCPRLTAGGSRSVMACWNVGRLVHRIVTGRKPGEKKILSADASDRQTVGSGFSNSSSSSVPAASRRPTGGRCR